MNWKTWLKGLLAAVISGAATGAAQVAQQDGKISKGTAVVAGVGALLGAVNYLKQSPIAPASTEPAAPAK